MALLLGPNAAGVLADEGPSPDLLQPLQWHLERIHAMDLPPAPPHAAPLAVLDSGADLTHVDLVGALWDGNALHGASFARPFGVFDQVPVGPNTTTFDEDGHGTAVAGIAGAVAGNTVGGRGVAQVPLMVVKTHALGAPLDQRAIADGVRYAVAHGARVISISATAPAASAELLAAVAFAEQHDVLVVAAAGNSGNSALQYPAALANVVAVAATDQNDRPAVFSSTGKVDISAPGIDIWTTRLANTYGATEGTSMAAPQVAATAALLRCLAPSLDVKMVRQILNETAEDVGGRGHDAATGHGVLDAAAAVHAAVLREADP